MKRVDGEEKRGQEGDRRALGGQLFVVLLNSLVIPGRQHPPGYTRVFRSAERPAQAYKEPGGRLDSKETGEQ